MLELKGDPMSRTEFDDILKATLSVWSVGKRNLKSGWLKVPIYQASLIEVAADRGFEFHHTAGGEHCILKKWLRPEEEDKVPPFATHQVGVAGFVLDDQDRLLVIKEKAHGNAAQWKLPGGMVDCGDPSKKTSTPKLTLISDPEVNHSRLPPAVRSSRKRGSKRTSNRFLHTGTGTVSLGANPTSMWYATVHFYIDTCICILSCLIIIPV